MQQSLKDNSTKFCICVYSEFWQIKFQPFFWTRKQILTQKKPFLIKSLVE